VQVDIRCVLSDELFFFLHWRLEGWYIRWSHGYIRAQGEACARATATCRRLYTQRLLSDVWDCHSIVYQEYGLLECYSRRNLTLKLEATGFEGLPYICTKLHCVMSQKDGTYANVRAILSSFLRRLTLNIVTKSYWICRQHDHYLYNKRKEYPLNVQRALHVH